MAVAAFEKPFQRILLRRPFCPSRSLPDDLLHPVKVRLADDGAMRPFIDDPVRLILRDCPLFMEAGLVPLAPHQRPGVLILVEDVQHRGRRPAVLFGGFAEPSAPRIFLPEVGARGQDALAVQPAGDGGTAHPLQGHIEDTLHHRRRVPVYHQLVPDRGVEPEAIGSEAAYVFALLHHDDLRRGGLDGQVLAVRLIDDVPQDHIHAGGHALVIIAVVAVIDGEIADTEEGKDALQIVAHLGIVPVASGKILRHHHIDGPGAKLLHKRLELRTVRVGPGVPIVHELRPGRCFQLGVAIQKLMDQLPLVADAVALGLPVPVRQGKADINAHPVISHRRPPPLSAPRTPAWRKIHRCS